MSKVFKVYNQKAENVGEVKLSNRVFGVKASEALVHQAMVSQAANERQVLAHTKDRSEVRGGGRKPWRQKGTGRARAGSTRSPIWMGGGVTFGPLKIRNFKKNINKKMRQKALLMVLSDKVSSESLLVLDKIIVEEYKTRKIDEMIKGFEKAKEGAEGAEVKSVSAPTKEAVNKKPEAAKDETGKKEKKKTVKKRSILVINDKKDEKTKRSFSNLVGVKFINLDNINILDLLKYKDLILTKGCVKILEEKYK